MRGAVDGAPTRHPLVAGLPALYQDDEFTVRFLSAFDEALAPVLSVLDSLAAYVDPELAPEDFLDWVASWVGVAVPEGCPVHRRRQLVAATPLLYAARGTVAGLVTHLVLLSGGTVEVEDSGGVTTSAVPGAPLPGTAPATVTVTVRGGDLRDREALEAAVDAARPAHVRAVLVLS